MVCRGESPCSPITYEQQFDAENRLTVVTNTVSTVVTAIGYDADGARLWQTTGVTTTVYVGDLMEVTIGPNTHVTRTYYYFGGQRIAMRTSNGITETLAYLHADHPSG